MTYKVATTCVSAVNVVTGSRVVNGTVISGRPTGTRREVRVSSATNEGVGGAASKSVAAATKVRATAAEVSTTATGEVPSTPATASVATATAAAVALGACGHRGPGGDR